MFGVFVDKAEHHYETIWRVIEAAVDYTHWPTFLIGVLAFLVMYTIKRVDPRLPYVLIAVALATLISWGSGFRHDIDTRMDMIESKQVAELIGKFNDEINYILVTGEARAILNPRIGKSMKAQEQICTRCHARHPVDLDMLRDESASETVRADILPNKALELHFQAGQSTQFIDQMKEKVHEERTRLRGMRFEAVGEEGGRMRFYPRGQLPPGKKGDGRLWRIKIGNQPLDTTRITMTGGGAVVGTIPGGLPELSVPRWDMSIFGELFLAAIIISILGFMEAISIAKAMAARTGQRLDPNQELIGQGLGNILGSFGQSYAVSGSFSRSAVNIQAGAVSGLSSVFTSGVVVIVLLFFTPLLYYLPQSVLAAVIMMAVVGLINFKAIVHAYRVQKSDGIISIISFTATLAFAPHLDKGIMIGVLLSVGMFLYRKMKPAVAELSLWRDGHLRSSSHFNLMQCRHIAVIRFDGPLFFANTSYLEDEVLDRVRSMPELKKLLFISDGINEIDASGEETLSLLIERLRSSGLDTYFSGVKEQVMETLRRAHLLEKIGEDHIFPTAAACLDAIWEDAHQDSREGSCPLREVVLGEGKAEPYRIRILLVDDEEDFTFFMSKRLVRHDMDVRAVSDGKSALEMLKSERFDVIVLDVKMPGMDGMQVLREIQKTNPRQAVIMLTGHAATLPDAIEGIRMGAIDYLVKPCDVDVLVGKIKGIYKKNM